jgi:hypothetical protein
MKLKNANEHGRDLILWQPGRTEENYENSQHIPCSSRVSDHVALKHMSHT